MCGTAVTIRLVKRSENIHQNVRGQGRLSLRGRVSAPPISFLLSFFFPCSRIHCCFKVIKGRGKQGPLGWVAAEVPEPRA